MTRKINLYIFLLFMGLQSAAFAGIEFQHLNFEQALEKAKKENKMVFVDVYAVWCGPCKFLSNEVFTDEELGEFINANFIPIKIDGEKEDGPALMERFQIDAYPTMLFVGADNELKKRIVGAESEDVILQAANTALHPEQAPEFIMGERFKSGDRDRAFLGEYLGVLLELDLDTEPVVAAFLEKYPDLNFEVEEEFIVFMLGVSDRSHPLMKEFLSKSSELAEESGYLTNIKFMMIFASLRDEFIEGRDASLITEEFGPLYDAYAKAMGEEAYDAEGLLTSILDPEIEE